MKTTKGFGYIRWFIILGIWSVATVVCLPVLVWVLPDAEARFWPVLTNQRIERVHLSDDGNFQLWEWLFFKNRRGFPKFISFMAYLPERPQDRVPVEVFNDWDCKTNFQTSRTSSRGSEMVKTMCARLPVPWRGRGDVIIDGYAEYQVGHPFYTVPVRIPADPDDWPAPDTKKPAG